MFTNRFFTVLVILALAAVIALTVREAVATSGIASNADTARWEAMGKYYENQAQRQHEAEDQPYIMDSASRSYIAWGEALQAAGKLGDSAAGSNTTQENIFASIDSNLDSATRSYIAWGLALQAAGKLGDSGACSNTTQENIFASIDSNLDSATRSYIAWGLALQAKDDIRALCR